MQIFSPAASAELEAAGAEAAGAEAAGAADSLAPQAARLRAMARASTVANSFFIC